MSALSVTVVVFFCLRLLFWGLRCFWGVGYYSLSLLKRVACVLGVRRDFSLLTPRLSAGCADRVCVSHKAVEIQQ